VLEHRQQEGSAQEARLAVQLAQHLGARPFVCDQLIPPGFRSNDQVMAVDLTIRQVRADLPHQSICLRKRSWLTIFS
jgi:hypothetical protein